MESLDNYAVADQLEAIPTDIAGIAIYGPYYDDFQFWRRVIRQPAAFWNKKLTFIEVSYSEWVPRIPGLGYTEAARIISRDLQNAVPLNLDRLIYRPSDKSGFVMSGVGSLKLPPDYDGYRLCSITTSRTCSKGVPVLIAPEVAAYHKLSNGDCLASITGVWQQMTTEWTKQFAITENLPRGYLVVRHPDELKKEKGIAQFYYDPFSVMEYEQDGILKWDYVFCNVPVDQPGQQKGIQDFFNDYRHLDGLNGKYLLNPDVGEPLFETAYNSPADYARAQLALMKERMNKTAIAGLNIDQVTAKIAVGYQDAFSLRVFAQKCGINAGQLSDDAPVKMAAQIVNLAIEANLLLELLQRFTIEQP